MSIDDSRHSKKLQYVKPLISSRIARGCGEGGNVTVNLLQFIKMYFTIKNCIHISIKKIIPFHRGWTHLILNQRLQSVHITLALIFQ